MTPADTGLTLPGTPESPAPKASAAISDLLAQAGDIASRAERANRPVSLIYLAAALLGISVCMAGYYFIGRMSAASMLSAETNKAESIEKLVATLKEFDRVNEERREELRPIPTMQTQITEAATSAGLKTKLAPAQGGSFKGPGDLTRRTWRYSDLHEDSLEKVIDWISRAQRTIPGLELTGLTLKPEATSWRVDVVFGRWERTSGS